MQIFLHNVLHCKADVVGRFFVSISQQIKVNGVTLDDYILPYHFIIIIPNWFTNISWSKQPWVLDFSNLNVANYVNVLSRLYSTTSLTYLIRFNYRQVVGCKTNLDWSAGTFKWKKKSMSSDMNIFDTGRRKFFFLLKFWFWIIRVGKSHDQDINLVWPYLKDSDYIKIFYCFFSFGTIPIILFFPDRRLESQISETASHSTTKLHSCMDLYPVMCSARFGVDPDYRSGSRAKSVFSDLPQYLWN